MKTNKIDWTDPHILKKIIKCPSDYSRTGPGRKVYPTHPSKGLSYNLQIDSTHLEFEYIRCMERSFNSYYLKDLPHNHWSYIDKPSSFSKDYYDSKDYLEKKKRTIFLEINYGTDIAASNLNATSFVFDNDESAYDGVCWIELKKKIPKTKTQTRGFTKQTKKI